MGCSTHPRGGDPEDLSLGAVWWVDQELLHHGAGIALLCDPYRDAGGRELRDWQADTRGSHGATVRGAADAVPIAPRRAPVDAVAAPTRALLPYPNSSEDLRSGAFGLGVRAAFEPDVRARRSWATDRSRQ